MKYSWNVVHDPLRLLAVSDTALLREREAREQGEDIIQAKSNDGKKLVADLGWYVDRYVILLVEDSSWDCPVSKVECYDLQSAIRSFKELLA